MKPIALCIVGCGAVVADLHMPLSAGYTVITLAC
jgi:hypothetical protein